MGAVIVLILGIMSALLLEIVNVYPALSPPSLTAHASNRVCNALALLQCVASHSETRSLFLNGESGFEVETDCSACAVVLVPIPQHDVENPAVRVSALDFAGGDWRFGQGESELCVAEGSKMKIRT